MRWLDSITNSMDMNLSKLQEIMKDRGTCRAIVHRFAESWTIKKAEELLLLSCGVGEVPRTARRSNQSILKEINLKYSMEGLMLKLQYFGQLMQRANSLEKTLMLGNIEGRKRRG